MRELTFQINEVVWAKLSGFPWWPAIIISRLENKSYEVLYFGDFTRSFLAAQSIRRFDESRLPEKPC